MARIETSLNHAPNFYVTEHFMYSDFICPCCDTLKHVPAFYRHVPLLEQMWEIFGFPIVVTSGYRCKRHNADVGGAPRSWHLLFATDIKPEEEYSDKLSEIRDVAEDLFSGIGIYETHIHLDLRPERLVWRG
ncbi:YcbK family protein [Candidatus Latescibacterota bacterium]